MPHSDVTVTLDTRQLREIDAKFTEHVEAIEGLANVVANCMKVIAALSDRLTRLEAIARERTEQC